MASCLTPLAADKPGWFVHPNGFQVEAHEAPLRDALMMLGERWPRSESVRTLLGDNERAVEDLRLLYQHGLIELRLPQMPEVCLPEQLNELNQQELQWGGYYTTAQHQRIDLPSATGAERFA
jgi:hypothetical protein